ncbi:MAG TPA: glycoside hydrolase family 9 protein, partial [Cyclobacteriaceae bacterium]|nr:glycoside hydrolase family 9 protein [Cyclobacteriaceae bacterium]
MKKTFFKTTSCLLILMVTSASYGQELSGEILVNHVGYPPKAVKVFLVAGEKPAQFRVINTSNNKTVSRGLTQSKPGYFGNYTEGSFTEVATEGTYVIEVNKLRSTPFRIASNVYEDAIKKSVTYFSIQRCGPSTTGYAAPCHVDDGRRLDTGPGWTMKTYRDVSGGWHDAGDYRKWVAFTLYGMIGLSRVAETMGPEWNRTQIEEELKWGNRYFLAMQNDAGYVMNFCGGDDGMFLTDNIPGTADDRPIHTEPASFVH